jgi:hypothetical protein
MPRPLKKLSSKPDRVPCLMAFCRCSECRPHQYVDTEAPNVKMGCMITLSLFKEHQKREMIKEAALKRLEHMAPPNPSILFPENAPVVDWSHLPLTEADTTHAAPVSGNITGGSPTTTLESKSSTPLKRKGKLKTPDTSPLYSLLCSLRNRLRIRPVTTFFQERSILFCNPPTKVSSKVPGYLDLDPSSPQNQAILTHERWLQDGLRRLEFQLKTTRHQTSSHERLLGVMVIRDIRTALDQLEKCKAEEWDKQHTAIKDRSAPVVDTGERIRNVKHYAELLDFSHLYVCSNTRNGTAYLHHLSIRLIPPPIGQCLSSKLQHRFIVYCPSLAPRTPRLYQPRVCDNFRINSPGHSDGYQLSGN